MTDARHCRDGPAGIAIEQLYAARPAVDRLASGAHEAVDKIAGAAAQAADALGAKGEQLKGVPVRVMDTGRGYVREHPVASLGIALAVGFVLGRLLSAR